MSKQPLQILYVVSRWREPTETFIRREVDAARHAGDNVTVLSLKPPAASVDGDPLVIHTSWRQVLWGAVWCAVRRPLTTVQTLAAIGVRSRATTLSSHVAAVAQGLAADRHVGDVDWIHAHFAWVATTAAYALARTRGQPYSAMIHAFDVYDRRVVDRFLGYKLRRAAFVAVESDRIRSDVGREFRCDPFVLRMGVPATYLVSNQEGPRPKHNRLIVSVGSLLPKKGHDILIDALSRLPPAVELKIIGEGPERSTLESLIKRLDLGGRVELLGALSESDVRAWLDQAAIFSLASRLTASGDRDGVPNALIEAMARGTAVVATAVSGIVDLLDGRGVLVEPEDPEGLATALADLLEDETRRAQLAEAGHAHVQGNYTTEENYDRLRARILSRLGALPRRR